MLTKRDIFNLVIDMYSRPHANYQDVIQTIVNKKIVSHGHVKLSPETLIVFMKSAAASAEVQVGSRG